MLLNDTTVELLDTDDNANVTQKVGPIYLTDVNNLSHGAGGSS